jgi:hypothetical protein
MLEVRGQPHAHLRTRGGEKSVRLAAGHSAAPAEQQVEQDGQQDGSEDDPDGSAGRAGHLEGGADGLDEDGRVRLR